MQSSALNLQDDCELALKAQAGSGAALDLIFERFEPIIRYYSRRYMCAGVDMEDLVQEGSIGLFSAVRRFRGDAGAKFKTYACLCIRRQILSAIRSANRNGFVLLENADIDFLGSAALNPEDVVVMKESISSLKNALLHGFSSFERRLFTLYISGFSYKAIAKELSVRTKKVDNSIQRIRRRLGILMQ